MRPLALTLLLLSVAAIWGWTFTVVKEATEDYGVLPFLALRFAIGSLALGVFSLRRIDRRSLLLGGAIGVALAVSYLFQTFGLAGIPALQWQGTSPTNCGLITGLFVVFAPIINRILFGVKVSYFVWGAVGASLVGLTLLTKVATETPRMGDLLTVGSALGFGLHIALLDRFAKGHHAGALAFAQVFAATLLFACACPLGGPVKCPGPEIWTALLITGVLATAFGFAVQTYAQQRLTAVRAAVIISMEPAFATFFGYALAGDRLNGAQIVGAILMFAAVVGVVVGPKWRKPVAGDRANT